MDKSDPEYARLDMFVQREEQRMSEMQRARFGGMVRKLLTHFLVILFMCSACTT
jgi:hypothetical protein